MRNILIAIWVMALFSGIGMLFWYFDLKYQLPTPVPTSYKRPPVGKIITADIPVENAQRPIFLHFFNPQCSCSRFNIENFKRLYNQYKDQLNFIIVVMSDKPYTKQQIQNTFGLPIPVTFNAAIATDCGVYSTPQVALLNWSRKLYYQGNYNRARYCADERSNYAKAAIIALLNKNAHLNISPFALRAYGCSLPTCNN